MQQPKAGTSKREEQGSEELECTMKRYRDEVNRKYEQLFKKCQEKTMRDEAKLKRLLQKEQRIRVMRRILAEESSCSSEDEERSRRYEEMCRQWIRVRQSMREDRQYLLHDEMEIEAIDQDQEQQTMFLDVDIRMTNTWTKTGKLTKVEPFEIVYRFDGTRIYRVLHSLETGEQIVQESEWRKVENVPVMTEDKGVQPPGVVKEENRTMTLEKEVQTAKETDDKPQDPGQQNKPRPDGSTEVLEQTVPLTPIEGRVITHLEHQKSVLKTLLEQEKEEEQQ